MVGISEKIKKAFGDSLHGKKFPVSGGTVAFIVFNILLISGFCRFSFFILKNHRSAIERDSLINTYVDVQPYNANKKAYSSYMAGNPSNKNAPAPFFKNSVDSVAVVSERTALPVAPLPVLNKPEGSKTVAAVRRPPVIKSVPRPPVVRKAPEPEETFSDKEGISLDSLILSGQTLLDKSEEQIAASELLLQKAYTAEMPDIPEQKAAESEKETVTAVKDEVFFPLPENSRQKTVIEKQLPTGQKKKEAGKKDPSTRWIDIAELRRQLSEEVKQKEIRTENAALLEMNGAKQIASSVKGTFSDFRPTPSLTPEKEQKTEKKNDAAAKDTVKPQIASGVAEAKEPKTVKTAEAPAPEKAVQTAVVQDIPFAGTEQAPQTERRTAAAKPSATVKRLALSGTSPDLWKVATVKSGVKKNVPEEPEKRTVPDEEKPDLRIAQNVPPATEAVLPKKEVIYRHGREIPVEHKEKNDKPLNWLERKEAAVWTSMSQSDTPSVWSTGSETVSSADKDRAKAFRVADEQPATPAEPNIVNSAPVRVVGEEVKPEAVENPLLLPLGAQATNQAANIPVQNMPPPVISGVPASVPKANPNGFSSLPSEQQIPQSKNAPAEESGIMNKFFSFFGKNDTAADSLPSIGSGTPVKPDEDKEKRNKPAENRTTAQNRRNTVQQTAPVKKTEEKQILPTELRLTFKPDSAEMSAQSVKWIKAFGQRAKKDIQNAVEVRMSNLNPDLQEKRFALIRSTLIGSGMEDVQIIPVMTDRTPHTIVLRMIVLPEEGYTEYTTDQNGVKEHLYYKQW